MFNFNDSIGKKILFNDSEVTLLDYDENSIIIKNQYGYEEKISLNDSFGIKLSNGGSFGYLRDIPENQKAEAKQALVGLAKTGDFGNLDNMYALNMKFEEGFSAKNGYFKQCEFTRCNFDSRSLQDSKFINCIFKNCTFDHTNFNSATVTNSFFINCNLTYMYTNASDFRGNKFRECIFTNDRQVKYLEGSNTIDYHINYYAKLFTVNGVKIYKYARLDDPLAFAEREEGESEQLRVNRKREIKEGHPYYYWVIRELKDGYSGDDVYDPIPSKEEFVESADEMDYEVSSQLAIRKGAERIKELAETSELVEYGLCTWRANNYILYIDKYIAKESGEGINIDGYVLVYDKTLTREEAEKE